MCFSWGVVLISHVLQYTSVHFFWLVLSAIFFVVEIPIASTVRRYHRDVGAMRCCLASFHLDQSESLCCTLNHRHPLSNTAMMCDRKVVQKCIEAWFGSVEAFHDYVRSDVSKALAHQLSNDVMSYWRIVETFSPVFWCFLDQLASNLKSPFLEDETTPLDSMMYFVLRGFVWWLAIIPSAIMIMFRVTHKLQKEHSRPSFDILKSTCIVLVGLLLTAAYAALDALPNWYMTGPYSVRSLPLAVASFAIHSIVWRCLPPLEPMSQPVCQPNRSNSIEKDPK